MLVPRNEMHNNKQCCLRFLRFGLMKKKQERHQTLKRKPKKESTFLSFTFHKISFRKMKQRQSGTTTTDPKVDFRTVQKRWRHRVRKMKPTNFTNACQFQRVNFWHLFTKTGKFSHTVKILHGRTSSLMQNSHRDKTRTVVELPAHVQTDRNIFAYLCRLLAFASSELQRNPP